MIKVPTTCHQAETLDSRLTRFTPKVFSRAWTTMITTNSTNVLTAVGSTPKVRAAKAIMVVAQP